MLKCVVLGFGSSGQRHAALLRERFPEGDILVYSSRPHEDSRFAITSSLADIAQFRPEVAVIAGVATQRIPMAEALPSGLQGVLIEKPLAENMARGSELASLLRTRAAITQVGYNLRFSPSLLEFRRRLEDGELGDVLSIRVETGQYLPSWRPERDYRKTASAQKRLGGGVLLELSHEIDYVRWIFGEVGWVSAWMGNSSDLEIDVEDSVHLTLGLAEKNRRTDRVAQVNLDLVRHDRNRTVTAVCAGGSIRWDGIFSSVETYTSATGSWDTVFAEHPGAPTTYERQWDSFFSSVQRGDSPEVSLDDGLAVLRVIEAARGSHDLAGIRVPVNQECAAP